MRNQKTYMVGLIVLLLVGLSVPALAQQNVGGITRTVGLLDISGVDLLHFSRRNKNKYRQCLEFT